MSGGLHFESEDIRQMPIHMQEQVAMSLIPQKQEPRPVAAQKVRVRRLCFGTPAGIDRYMVLKDAVREGVIVNLELKEYDGRIVAFIYNVIWAGDFLPHTIPINTLLFWRERVREHGSGTMVYEKVKRNYEDEEKIPKIEAGSLP